MGCFIRGLAPHRRAGTQSCGTLGERRYQTLIEYAMAHASIAQENMLRKAGQQAQLMAAGNPESETPADPQIPGAVPSPATQVRTVASHLP